MQKTIVKLRTDEILAREPLAVKLPLVFAEM